MQHDKAQLGNRFTCFQCGTKFYDLNRPTPTCPECDADQNDAPANDIRSLLSARRRAAKAAKAAAAEAAPPVVQEEEEDDEFDDIGDLDDADDSDDDDEDDEA